MGVVGMVNAAKNSRKLYEEMRSVGFEDDEFPVWWYSPSREQQEQLKEKREQPSAEVNGGEPFRGEQRVLDPVSPRRAVSIEDRRSRPNLDAQLSTPQLTTVQDTIIQETTPQFTDAQLQLLEARNIRHLDSTGE